MFVSQYGIVYEYQIVRRVKEKSTTNKNVLCIYLVQLVVFKYGRKTLTPHVDLRIKERSTCQFLASP